MNIIELHSIHVLVSKDCDMTRVWSYAHNKIFARSNCPDILLILFITIILEG